MLLGIAQIPLKYQTPPNPNKFAVAASRSDRAMQCSRAWYVWCPRHPHVQQSERRITVMMSRNELWADPIV